MPFNYNMSTHHSLLVEGQRASFYSAMCGSCGEEMEIFGVEFTEGFNVQENTEHPGKDHTKDGFTYLFSIIISNENFQANLYQ